MLPYLLYAFLGGYLAFLLGMAVFMYRENRKFGDNQFTVKLLPPPPRLSRAIEEALAAGAATPDPAGASDASIGPGLPDWAAVAVRPAELSRASAPRPAQHRA